MAELQKSPEIHVGQDRYPACFILQAESTIFLGTVLSGAVEPFPLKVQEQICSVSSWKLRELSSEQATGLILINTESEPVP
jgi:hypothetical protein